MTDGVQQNQDSEEKQGQVHRAPSRGQVKRDKSRNPDRDRSVVPESSLIAGKFGRMFRNLPSFEPSEGTIEQCVKKMVENSDEASDNPEIPAGFTYLGQFIDHDLTFDPVSDLQRQNDPDGLHNFRTPRLDLDSLYGAGPHPQPYLYQKSDRETPNGDPAKFLLGKGKVSGDKKPSERADTDEDDLPRNLNGVAIIGDPRNDENILVSQLQLAFIKLHNRLVDDIRTAIAGKDNPESLEPHLKALLNSLWDKSDGGVFREAQRLTRWHYQWVVLKEFLPKICGERIVNDLLEETPVDEAGNLLKSLEDSAGNYSSQESATATHRRVGQLQYYKPKEIPFIPVEWSVAAYRYGHSQVRPGYNLNSFLEENNPNIPIFVENPSKDNALKHLAGGRHLPEFWTLEWRLFFDYHPPESSEERTEPNPQKSRLIDSKLVGGLKFLPGVTDGHKFLADRNLRRGRSMGLPSGQSVARHMSVKPLDKEELGLEGEAPLWFYILKESEVKVKDEQGKGGKHLGPVGGRIVAEVILGILKEDPFSFLRTEPTWEPVLERRSEGSQDKWGMADLLSYAVPNDGRSFSQSGQTPNGPV